MKKINELRAERSELIEKMKAILAEIDTVIAEAEAAEAAEETEETEPVEGEEDVEENSQKVITEKRSAWNKANDKIKAIDESIALLERQEELNKTNVRKMENNLSNQTSTTLFRDWLKGAVEEGKTTSFRADPIVSTTNTAIINKEVANSVDILTSPGEAFLKELGVTFYPNLTGNFVVPSMAESTAAFVNEGSIGNSASMTPESLTLAARILPFTQKVSKLTLAQTNPAIYNGILQNLVNGIWNAITNDVFDQLEADAATQIVTANASGLDFGTLVNMEASIGGLDIGAGAYVTTPAVKSYLKQKVETTYGDAIWKDNEINGYPAYGVPAANTNKVYFGDFSRMAIGQWGGIEITVDQISLAGTGEIVLTATALVDTGCTNKRALVFTSDVSAAV